MSRALHTAGYFIVNGNEKIIRQLVIPRRNHITALIRPSFNKRGPKYTEYGCMIRCVRPDQSSQSLTVHYLTDGTFVLGFTYRYVTHCVRLFPRSSGCSSAS
jgi:DNA-directed RNA polymerase I subunit RPA2